MGEQKSPEIVRVRVRCAKVEGGKIVLHTIHDPACPDTSAGEATLVFEDAAVIAGTTPGAEYYLALLPTPGPNVAVAAVNPEETS